MKAAIIGLGVIGKVHLNVIKNLNEDLVGVCDIDIEKLNDFNDEISYTDYKKMLCETKPDIVHICTPHYLHKEMIIYALERNIHVLCEKPLCISYDELSEIEAVCKISNAQLGVCYQNRYVPANIFVREYLKGQDIISVKGTLMWHRDSKYYNQASWRGTKKYEGGGVLINQAIHTIDLLQLFYGMPDNITAHLDNISLQNIIEVEDTAIIHSSDNSFMLMATNAAVYDFPIKISIRTSKEKIDIISDCVYIDGKIYNCEVLNDIPGAKKTYGGGHNSIIKDFYYCISNNKKFDIDFYEASKSLKIVLAAYSSYGKNIKI